MLSDHQDNVKVFPFQLLFQAVGLIRERQSNSSHLWHGRNLLFDLSDLQTSNNNLPKGGQA